MIDITIGGKVPAALLGEFLDRLNSTGAKVGRHGGEEFRTAEQLRRVLDDNGYLILVADQDRQLDDVEDFCVKHGMPFDRHATAGNTCFRPGTKHPLPLGKGSDALLDAGNILIIYTGSAPGFVSTTSSTASSQCGTILVITLSAAILRFCCQLSFDRFALRSDSRFARQRSFIASMIWTGFSLMLWRVYCTSGSSVWISTPARIKSRNNENASSSVSRLKRSSASTTNIHGVFIVFGFPSPPLTAQESDQVRLPSDSCCGSPICPCPRTSGQHQDAVVFVHSI